MYPYILQYACNASGLKVHKYRYLDRETQGLDLPGLLEDVNNAPDGSAFLLHACAVGVLQKRVSTQTIRLGVSLV